MTLFRREMRANRLSLVLWCGIICAMTALTMLLFPSFKDQMGSLSSIMGMLGPFSAALGLDQIDMTSAIGFYGIETGTMLAVGGSMFAAFTGIGLLAKEEGGHTAEFLATQPISRTRIVAEKLLALLALLVLFNIVCIAAGWLCFIAIGEPLPLGDFLRFHLLQFILQVEIGCICYGLSAFSRRSQIGIGLGIALLLYFMSLILNMVDTVRWLRFVTPFYYADATRILTGKPAEAAPLIIAAVVTASGIFAAFFQYNRKDIAA